MEQKTVITIQAEINAPLNKVWEIWNEPKHIINWNYASDDWHSPKAENDLRPGGKFSYRMEAKDGSMGFDFGGIYTRVELHKAIEYVIEDGRNVTISFTEKDGKTSVIESFEAEDMNSAELQQAGWQSILNNLKKYAEQYVEEASMHFEIFIKASPEKVHKMMIGEKSYHDWTSVFNPSSDFKGSWEKGSKILFIGTDENEKTGGMVSYIKENVPGKFISIEHAGILEGDKEVMNGTEVEEWAGAHENYIFMPVEEGTLLSIDIDTHKSYRDYFGETWPKALELLKNLCEE